MIHRTTRSGQGQEILLRSVKISDEPLIKDFFYSLSDESMYTSFISARRNVPHEMRQNFVVDYSRDMVILAVGEDLERERERRSLASASTAPTATCTSPRWPWW